VLEGLTAESFKPHIGTGFRVTDVQPPLELRLDRVEVYTRAGADRQPFSLFFLGPTGAVLSQRIYHLEHAMGGMDIFIVPIGASAEGVSYEAVFT
jgi:hypothetical protein